MNDTLRMNHSAFIHVDANLLLISIFEHEALGDNLYTYQTVFFLMKIY